MPSLLIELKDKTITEPPVNLKTASSSEPLGLTCKICGKTFKMEKFFREHVDRHEQCKICKKYFLNKRYLSLHSWVHIPDKPVQCPKCGRGFKNELHVQHHMRIHEPPVNITCQICNIVFKRHESLRLHMKAQHPEPEEIRAYECYVCKKTQLKSLAQLRTHMYDHFRPRNWLCPQCGKRYAAEYSLNLHLMRDDHNVRGEVLKPFHCDLCPTRFSTKHKAVAHAAIHTGERMFACNVCGKSFATSGNLSQHRRVHMEQKHHCALCDHKCRSAGNLKKHMRKHTGRY